MSTVSLSLTMIITLTFKALCMKREMGGLWDCSSSVNICFYMTLVMDQKNSICLDIVSESHKNQMGRKIFHSHGHSNGHNRVIRNQKNPQFFFIPENLQGLPKLLVLKITGMRIKNPRMKATIDDHVGRIWF